MVTKPRVCCDHTHAYTEFRICSKGIWGAIGQSLRFAGSYLIKAKQTLIIVHTPNDAALAHSPCVVKLHPRTPEGSVLRPVHV